MITVGPWEPGVSQPSDPNLLSVIYHGGLQREKISMKLMHTAAPPEAEEVEIDLDLPLCASWGLELEEPRYWRTGDFRRSMLQIGFAPTTGEFRTVTLVVMLDVGRAAPSDTIRPLPTTVGVPRAQAIPGEDRFVSEPGELKALLGEDNLILRMAGSDSACRTICSGRVLFGVDVDDQLVAIEVTRLDEHEWRQLADQSVPDGV